MNSAESAGERPPSKLHIQVDLIVGAFKEKGIGVGVAHCPDGSLDFLYEHGVILVRDEYLPQVAAFLARGDRPGRGRDDAPGRDTAGGTPGRGTTDGGTAGGGTAGPGDQPGYGDRPGHGDQPGHGAGRGGEGGRGAAAEASATGLLPGVSLYPLAGTRFPEVLEALDEIDARFGPGVATPSHILSITPVWPCPATEPGEVPPGSQPEPGLCGGGGNGVFVYVADTGLLADADDHPWLAGVTGQEDPPGGLGPAIDGYTGHGTFVAGVARCMAPAAKVRVGRDFDMAGALSEHLVVRRLGAALGLGADVINLSAGGTTRKNLPLLSFEAFWNTYRHYKGTVLVASAGNNSTRRPFWPAAFPQVVSVGAVAATGRSRAYFSDFGPWVDVYAPGEGLVNAFASGKYICREPPHIGEVRHFGGMARWSGTSFAAPLVAGLIAARISRTGEDGRQAAAALLAQARAQRVPGLGPVLWPCDTGGCGCSERQDPPAACGCGCHHRWDGG